MPKPAYLVGQASDFLTHSVEAVETPLLADYAATGAKGKLGFMKRGLAWILRHGRRKMPHRPGSNGTLRRKWINALRQ
jgi:hypothetical protein